MRKTTASLLAVIICISTLMPFEASAAEADTDVDAGTSVVSSSDEVSAQAATEVADTSEDTEEISGDVQEDEGEDITIGKTTVKTYLKSTSIINVKWTKVSGATGYTVYRSTSKDGTYKKVKTVGASTLQCLCTGLGKGKTHYFKVETRKKVSDDELYTAMSDVVSRKTPSKLTKSSTGYSTTYASEIIDTANKKKGSQYVYGASGPNSFDCSGFVYWVYKKADVAGKDVSRTSAQGLYNSLKKYNIGKSYSKAQPGDIVLMSSGGKTSGIYHAAIYYGNNKLIHATNPRTDVCVTSTNWSGGSKNVAAILRLPNM